MISSQRLRPLDHEAGQGQKLKFDISVLSSTDIRNCNNSRFFHTLVCEVIALPTLNKNRRTKGIQREKNMRKEKQNEEYNFVTSR